MDSHLFYLQVKNMTPEDLIDVLANSESEEEETFWISCYNFFLGRKANEVVKKNNG